MAMEKNTIKTLNFNTYIHTYIHIYIHSIKKECSGLNGAPSCPTNNICPYQFLEPLEMTLLEKGH